MCYLHCRAPFVAASAWHRQIDTCRYRMHHQTTDCHNSWHAMDQGMSRLDLLQDVIVALLYTVAM